MKKLFFNNGVRLVVFLLAISVQQAMMSESGYEMNKGEDDNASSTMTPHDHGNKGVSVAGFHIEKLAWHISILLFITVVMVMKMVYHYMETIATYIPESCLLIAIGVCFGAILKVAAPEFLMKFHLTSNIFFFILLPPIVLEAAYSLYNQTFADNMGVVIIFAVVGTIFNFIFIGFGMFALHELGWMGGPQLTFDVRQFLLFASIVVAVDPVAVLAIFSEIGVDKSLYFMVFGESLLNDAVTIVLYNIMAVLCKQPVVSTDQIVLGVISFFTVSLGGLLVGICVGVLCCLMTRCSVSLRYLEPMIIFVFAYLSYVMGDLFEWSGIISMVGCGLVQSAYAFHNVSWKSLVVVKRASKVAASLSEAIIFFYLGMEIFIQELRWHTGFHIWAVVLCLIIRFLVTFLLCLVINWAKVDQQRISYTEQLIMSYGGLRGAVSFSLSALVTSSMVGGTENAQLILTATFIIILFTVVPMGMTIKPLVKFMKVRLEGDNIWSLFGQMNETINFHMLAGLESVSENFGRNRFRVFFQRIDDKYVRFYLQRDPETHSQKIVKTYQKVALAMHYASIDPKQSEHYLEKLSGNLRRCYSSQVSMSSIVKNPTELSISTPLPESRVVIEPRKSISSPVNKSLGNEKDIPMATDILRRARNSIAPDDEDDFFSQFSQVMQNKKRVLRQKTPKHVSQPLSDYPSGGHHYRRGKVNEAFKMDDIELGEIVSSDKQQKEETPQSSNKEKQSEDETSTSSSDDFPPFVEELSRQRKFSAAVPSKKRQANRKISFDVAVMKRSEF